MAPKKRKPRTVVTDATKAKLPTPKRKTRRVEVYPQCDQCKRTFVVNAFVGKPAEMSCECGNVLRFIAAKPKRKRTAVGTMPEEFYHNADVSPPRAIPCGEETIPVDWPWGGTITRAGWSQPFPSPIAEQNPWPVRVLNWLDEAPTKARRRIAAWLRALAGRVDA